MKKENLIPGQLFYDKDHVFNLSIDMYYLLLSRDKEDDQEFYWRVAEFLFIDPKRLKGAPVHKLTDKEVLQFEYIGSLTDLIDMSHNNDACSRTGGTILERYEDERMKKLKRKKYKKSC